MLQTVKHTPGPWQCNASPISEDLYSVWDRYGNYLTTSDAEHEANAQLIAAAPELAVALQYLIYEITHLAPGPTENGYRCIVNADLVEQARAVIRKALGEAA